MRYRSTLLVGTLSLFLLSPMYTNGQIKPGPLPPALQPRILNGPPDLAVNVTANTVYLVGSSTNYINQLATLSISINNLVTQQSATPLVLVGSDAHSVAVRIALDKNLFQVGNFGADSGFTCTMMQNNVVCTGGTIAAGRQAHISVDVAGVQGPCSVVAPVTVVVNPAQGEVNQTNNTATTQLTVYNIC
jgi:hypothetical protein